MAPSTARRALKKGPGKRIGDSRGRKKGLCVKKTSKKKEPRNEDEDTFGAVAIRPTIEDVYKPRLYVHESTVGHR